MSSPLEKGRAIAEDRSASPEAQSALALSMLTDMDASRPVILSEVEGSICYSAIHTKQTGKSNVQAFFSEEGGRRPDDGLKS